MNISIPKEHRPYEYRVGIAPEELHLLTRHGEHTCFVEHDAGLGSGFTDEDYQKAGARIVYSRDEAFLRADLVLKVERPTEEELGWMREGQILVGFLTLPSAPQSKIETLLGKRITAVSYEEIEESNGDRPVMKPLSQIGGRMCAQIAARCLENDEGGKGILLSGVPGVAPANVVIIGAGVVGIEAARAFLGVGASVHVLDQNLGRLQYVDRLFSGRAVTIMAYPINIAQACTFADVLVSCVRVPGKRAPIVVTRDMISQMRPRSLIMDISIDEGGSVETSRPTTHDQPTYIKDDMIHYCVTNIPGVVARTATHAYLNAAWPFIQMLTSEGIESIITNDSSLAKGVTIHNGRIIDPHLAAQFDLER